MRISLIFYNSMVCYVFSLESPQCKKEKLSLIILSLPLWDFFKGLKNEFETAVVDEPSVFEPLKFCCIYSTISLP